MTLSFDAHTSPTTTMQVHSGDSLHKELIESSLTKMSLDARMLAVEIIVDKPWGYAFDMLAKPTDAYTLVVTDNPCGEYWDDIWDSNCTVLVAGQSSLAELELALHMASRGKRQRIARAYRSPLTESERPILKLCALAYTNKQIAKVLDLSEQTVRNRLNIIYQKLQIKNRSQAVLYYWGLNHLTVERES